MSDALKAIALTQAVELGKIASHDAATIVTNAKKFFEFLKSEIAAVVKAVEGKADAAKPTPATKAVTKAVTKPTKTEEQIVAEAQAKAQAESDAADAAEEKGATKENVGALLTQLLSENLRKEAVALLTEFGAKKASEIKPEDYGSFVEKANALLMAS